MLIQTVYRYFNSLNADSKKRLRTFFTTRAPWVVDAYASTMRNDLKALASVYGSDKWNYHWYAQHYEHHLAYLRNKKMNILEVGIGGYEDPQAGGASLRMWRSYFPNAHVYGIDICDKSPHNERRITTLKGSQVDLGFLDAVVQKIGKIDIIIDDGSHINEHVITTFHHLFPHLANGGIYAIEDIETSYWPDGGQLTERNDPTTSMGFFKSLVDGLNYEEFKTPHEPSYFDKSIMSIAFYHNLIIIKKVEGQR
jgi:hypothetical protein